MSRPKSDTSAAVKITTCLSQQEAVTLDELVLKFKQSGKYEMTRSSVVRMIVAKFLAREKLVERPGLDPGQGQ